MSDDKIVVYGVELSQPTRTVTWLLRYHDVPFTIKPTNPGSNKPNGSRHPDFLAMNPAGTVPVIKDTDGTIIGESNAIITYLAEKYGWNDVFPQGKGNEAKRAQINYWLNWGHLNSRGFSGAFFAPIFRPDLKFNPDAMAERKKACTNAAKVLDGWLANNTWLAKGSTAPTLADFAVFADMGQLDDLALFDFSGFKNVLRWFGQMRKLKAYKESHVLLEKVAKPAVEKYRKAQAKM